MSLIKRLLSGNWRRLIGLAWFDLVWFAAVAGRDGWLLATAVLVAVQIYISTAGRPFQLRLYAQLLLLGLVLEATAVASGVISFNEGWLPLWLVLLWAGFVAMLMNTLDWVAGRYWLAALIGILSGPLTYAIGIRLDAAELLQPEWQLWLLYALLWALYMVIFAKLMALNGSQHNAEVSSSS
jgi:hypothetical protein